MAQALPHELQDAFNSAQESGADASHWTSDAAVKDFKRILEMVAERKMEALALYEPTPFQEQYHACRAKECLLAKGNQTGGSVAGFIEDARAVTGQDPYKKYRERDGIVGCVGYGAGHIGKVMYRYLRQWGAFEIIADKETGLYRTYRPWPESKIIHGKAGDLERAAEARPAPPFIPDRFMAGRPSWTKKSENQFSVMRFTTGWQLYAFNSQGDYEHAQGFQADLFHIDEDTATGGWVSEAYGRLSKRRGLFRMTAMPHAKTEDVPLLLQRCEDEEQRVKDEGGQPSSVVIYAGIDDNPYLPDETKEENKRIWKTMGEAEYRRRVEGRLNTSGLRMYPSFNIRTHRAIVQLSSEEEAAEKSGRQFRHPIQKLLTESNGVPPEDWCVYVTIDPGHTITACEFLAVPNPKLGHFIVMFDEIYMPEATASRFIDALEAKVRNKRIQEYILDFHGAKIGSIVDGRRALDEYERMMQERGIESTNRGSRFLPACDKIDLREMTMREALEIRSNGQEAGYPTLLVVEDRCPNFIKEIGRFNKIVQKINGHDVILDKANRNGMCHAIEAVEGAIGNRLIYIEPPKKKDGDGRREVKKPRRLKRVASSVMMLGRNINMGARGVSE